MLNWSKTKHRLWNAISKRHDKKDPCIEIRGDVSGKAYHARFGMTNVSANLLIVIRPDLSTTISANGKMVLSDNVWREMVQVIQEAKDAMQMPMDEFLVWIGLQQ